MINKVIKRDGRQTTFSERRVREAVSKAMRAAGVSTYGTIEQITGSCVNAINVKFEDTATVEEIQDTIIKVLTEMNLNEVVNEFVEYRENRTSIREKKSHIMKAINKIAEETSRENANVGNNFSAKLLQIASVANKWANLASMPKEHAKAHERGDIHIHDVDSFNLTVNCLNVDTEKALKKGFNTGYGTLNSPKRIESAAELSCILLQSTQNDMFGGQSHVDFDNAMAKYVEMTCNEVIEEIKELVDGSDKSSDTIKILEKRVNKRVSQAMQAVVFNLNTMHSRAGSQVPFSSVNIGLPRDRYAALACEHFLKEYNKGLGKGEQPIFPNVIFRVKEGVNANPEDQYYYLYELACEVAANRMNPTFLLLDSPTNKKWYDKGYIAARMGCRTNVMENINGEHGPASRGNNFPVTINLPRVGIEAKKDWKRFYSKLGSLMDLCYDELMYRYGVASKLKVKDLPFVVGQELLMGAEGLKANDSIEPILKHGTMGIGFIGLAETLVAMMGVHHGESDEALEKGLEISTFMYDRIQEYKKKSHLNFGLYHTPAEGLAGRFSPMDRKKYGVIEGVTDRDYYTNSVHIPVHYNIGAVDKIVREGKFHKHGTAGNIAYIEIDGGDVESRKQFIMKHLKLTRKFSEADYVAYNFHIRTCRDCGTRLENGEQFCPSCNSSNIQGVTRVTGYMSLDERFGPGKKAERADRIKHS